MSHIAAALWILEWAKRCSYDDERCDVEEAEKHTANSAVEAEDVALPDALTEEDAVVVVALDAHITERTVIGFAIDLELASVAPV